MSRMVVERIFCDYCDKEITNEDLYSLREESGFDSCCKEHVEILRDKEAQKGVRMLLEDD
jgi:hypothetical protein